ncbi:Aste57867_14529 [Aphanomyces stellatus]|uniref:Aste57867_14529 protein n=1 Tax=Aphanomyces stellatus TaxID=120398 RepID=A0A485L187_9STRA|nr:hypothetical protein As57867_014475 [Aphanomyces stellatus]VFT91351.1 Aste57867_14529 [Aphanomyces stellatus]
MRAIYVVGLIFAVVALWAATLGTPPSLRAVFTESIDGKPRSVAEKRAMTVAFVERMLQEQPIPGYSLSVVYRNETVLAQGFGTKQYGNPNTSVTASTLFQIGSYTKTFTALGIAKLVDDGLVGWNDRVKQHLPWFQLMDKYAEAHTTLADLLSMNSVFGAHEGDIPQLFGVFASERDLVEHLAFLNTTRSFRDGYAYSNMNFVILGQVIQHVTNQTWFEFLKATYLEPLGMNETFGQVWDIPHRADAISSGHIVCGNHVLGPFQPFNATMVALSPRNNRSADGSILSSANDMAKFSRFLLSHGHGILKSPNVVQDMTTGHTVIASHIDGVSSAGYTFHRDGNVQAYGYGIDTVGTLMYGYDYFDKDGDTPAFAMRTGFIPTEGLAVTLNANAEPTQDDGFTYVVSRMRTYILGIFLDISVDELEATWQAALARSGEIPADEVQCDAHYFDGEPWANVAIASDKETNLVGAYEFTESRGYNGKVTITKPHDQQIMQWGAYTKPLLATSRDATEFIWALELGAMTFTVDVTWSNASKPSLSIAGMELLKVE